MYQRYFKRIFDVLCCGAAIAVFWWLFLIVAIAVRVNMGAPILFTQDRPGKDEKIFKLYKFRTMMNQVDDCGIQKSDDERLTKFGRILRKTSLDELPEIINILKGDMSIVGPRPLLVEYLPYYKDAERHRHDVLPGLTGWAQVNGRNAIDSWEQRFEHDLYYINHVSFALDLRIILLTVRKAFVGTDVQVGSEIKVGRLDNARKEL